MTSRRTTVLALLLAAAICPYFVNLGGSAIWDANEAFYVETPREMIERGDYVSPTFNYEPRLNKPVLSYWIVAAFYHAFGISPGVQRIPIAIGAVVLIASAFLLAWTAFPMARGEPHDRASLRRDAALWAALGLAVTPRLLMFARRIFIDIYISMFLALTLVFFALSERYPARRRLFLSLMYVAVALGVLTKGPIAIVLPGLAFALYLVVHRELGRVREMMIPAGIAIVSAVVLPYCAALYARHGWEPITAFIVGENVARYTDGVGVDAERPVWFYLPVIFSDAFPWSAFLFVAAAAWLRGRRPDAAAAIDEGVDRSQRVVTLLWLWIAAIVLFFTASHAKQDLYIFPIVPAVAALGGLALARGPAGGVRWTSVVVGVLTAAAGVGVVYLLGGRSRFYAIEGAFEMGVAGVVGGLVVAVAAMANRPRTSAVTLAVTFIVLDWIFVLRILPGFERYKPVPGFAQTLAPRVQTDDVVLTYDEALPSLVYYLRRHVDPYFAADLVIERFKSGKTVYAILSADNYRDIRDSIGTPTCILDRRPTFDVKLRNMLAEDPPPELLLITNRCSQQ